MALSSLEIKSLAETYKEGEAQDILKLALENYQNIAVSFSGAEDVVLIDMAARIGKDVRVFTLDTGRLHAETYAYLEQVREHYDVEIEVAAPDHRELEPFLQEKGMFSFFTDGHKECCTIRKVSPLRRKLATLDAWITGQRHDQSNTRVDVPVIQEDPAFSTEDNTLVKFNPLANWSSQQVWNYILENEVPYNPLHAQGFDSIGCQPCTRPILPNQHERVGRWWWEEADEKECGLHSGNVNK